MLVLELVAAAALCLAVHLGVMAVLANTFGVTVRRVTYGIGPTLYTGRLLHVKALPLSGHVKLKDSREEALEEGDWRDAFDHQAVWKQVFVPLAGSGSLIAVAVVVLGVEGWTSFARGFEQIFLGALSPLGSAQVFLRSFATFAQAHSFIALAGLVAAKLAAVNLLPFGALNGGQALMTLVRFGRPKMQFEDAVARWGILVTLLLFASWVVAAIEFSILPNAS